MRPIEYRARFEIEDYAPIEAEEYAREELRRKVLNDFDYQLEVIKDIHKLRDYIQSNLDRHKKFIEENSNYFVYSKTAIAVEQSEILAKQCEDYIGYIDYMLKVRNEQLKRNQEK